MHRIFLFVGVLGGLALASAGCAHRTSSPPLPSLVGGYESDTARQLVDILRDVWSSDSAAAQAWPGFSLRRQSLIVTTANGPIALAGQAAVPSDFQRVLQDSQIYLRLGTPPDSLPNAHKFFYAWGGTPALATLVNFTGATTRHTLVHEAFHAYQDTKRRSGQFLGSGGNTGLTNPSVDVLWNIDLEGDALARALRAHDSTAIRNAVVEFLALRHRRCSVLVPRRTCESERAIEHREGTADFVADLALASLSKQSPAERRRRLADTLNPVRSVERLDRFHFYDRGNALLQLIAELAPTNWQLRAAVLQPDSLLSALVGFDSSDGNQRLATILDRPRAAELRNHALATFARWRQRTDSIADVFEHLPGTRIVVHTALLPNRATGDPQSVTAVVPHGADTTDITINLSEARMWFGSDSIFIANRQAKRTTCCTLFSVEAKAMTAGIEAIVAGRRVPLDVRGTTSGSIDVRLGTIDVRSPRGTLSVFSDSIVITIP